MPTGRDLTWCQNSGVLRGTSERRADDRCKKDCNYTSDVSPSEWSIYQDYMVPKHNGMKRENLLDKWERKRLKKDLLS